MTLSEKEYEQEYPSGSEAIKNVKEEYFEDVFEPLAGGKGVPSQKGFLGDVYPLQGAAEYRGWYQVAGSTKSRWCPKQSKFDGPRANGKKHGAADLFSYGREKLLAITSGNVEYRPPQPSGWGNHIYLYFKRNGQNYIAVYAHIDSSSAFSGVKNVTAGDIIGKAGCSGNAGNNDTCWRLFKCNNKIAVEDHLHIELFSAKEPEKKLDPVSFFGWTVKFSDDLTCSECGSSEQCV